MKYILSIFLLILPTVLFSQNNEQDENELSDLKRGINYENPSKSDLKKVMKISNYFSRIDLDSALHYSSIAIKMAAKMENPNLLASAKRGKSVILKNLQQPDLAYELLMENVASRKLISDTTLAKTYLTLARVEIQKGLIAESFEHAVSASEIYIKRKDSIPAADCFAHIAGIQIFAKDDPDAAIPYFEKARLYSVSNEGSNTIRLLINYSSALVRLGRFKEAVKMMEQAEALFRKSENKSFEASIYIQYGLIYNTAKNYRESLKYCLLADSVLHSKPVMDLRTQGKVHKFLALNYKELKEYDKAIFYFKSLENSVFLEPWTINGHLIELYKEIGDFEKAFLLQEKLIAAKDSTDSYIQNEKLTEVIEKYEGEKKEQMITTLNAEKKVKDSQIRTQRFILYGTICFFIVLFAIGVFWFRTRAKLRETTLNLKTAELQQRFLRTQLNPHFFFHALTSIETYIYKNDKLKSAGFLRDFSLLMRNILESSDVDFIPLRQDIDFIKKYIELQQLNHEFKFNYELSVSPDLNVDRINIPPMLIQPAVENAILHGALSREDGLIFIDYSKIGNEVQISIRDNGEVRKPKKVSSSRLNRSMSLDITQTRILNFEEVHGVKIHYRPFDANGNDDDSFVIFRIPLSF